MQQALTNGKIRPPCCNGTRVDVYRFLGFWPDLTTIRARLVLEFRSETYRTRLEIGPDLLSCSIKRNRVRVDIRVRLKKVELDYPETGKHPC